MRPSSTQRIEETRSASGLFEVALIEDDDVIQVFSAECTDYSFTEAVRTQTSVRGFQDTQAQLSDRIIIKISLAIRSSPQPTWSCAISRMSARSYGGIRGLPVRHLHRQNSRNPARSHPIKDSGVIFTKASFQASPRETSTSINRDTLSNSFSMSCLKKI
jgi:hypothetical protein